MRFFWNFCLKLLICLCVFCQEIEAQPNLNAEIPPEYIGGKQQLALDIRRYLVYPENAKSRNISGNVVVEFEVDSNGKVHNTKVIAGIIPSMDSAAINVINFLDNWKPGLVNGVPKAATVKLPIEFRLYYSSISNENNNQIVKDIRKYQSNISRYLINDSIAMMGDLIDTIPKNLYPNYYQIFSFNTYVMLQLISQQYLLATDHIKNNLNDYSYKINAEGQVLNQTIDIYLKTNFAQVANNLNRAAIDAPSKKILKLFMANDSLQRFKDPKNITRGRYNNDDITYVAKRSKMGYHYLQTTQDTSYNAYVREFIVAEERLKAFALGFSLGYGKIFHNTQNSKTYTNPNMMHLSWDLFYKEIYAILGINVGGSKNYLPVTIDTFNLMPSTQLGNFYTQLGLGYRFYPHDLLHIIPYFSYNIFDVNYSYDVTKEKTISKNKYFETNFSAGLAASVFFTKNNWRNYKPANFFPMGISLKYGLILPENKINKDNISHFFSISYTLLFTGPSKQ